MNVFEGTSFSETYIKLIKELMKCKYMKSPRGQKVSYLQNCLFVVKNPGDVFSCPSREYPFKYLNNELKLYFSGDCSADSFAKASKFWKQLANPDGNINSNYGYLCFYKPIETKFGNIKNQWTYAKQQLIKDKDTRQALMFISSPYVQFEGNKDFICTLNYIFNINDNILSLTVNRRSQDMYFGLPHDVNYENCLLLKMCNELQEYYPELRPGSYTMFCNNAHIYERNFEVFNNMIKDYDNNNYQKLDLINNIDSEILDKYVFNKEFGN